MSRPDARRDASFGGHQGAPTFDLQSHSWHSDGALPPAEVVARAARAGVELLALSDHDSIDGVPEAVTAARACGITVVPAVELSALDEGYEDFHVLGYGLDHRSPELLTALARFRADRQRRAERMAAALEQEGLKVDPAPLERRRRAGGAVGRPHLAAAVLAHPDNAQRLSAEGLRGVGDVLEAYLVPGRPGYRPRSEPTVAQAIEVIHAAAGLAVWAHPYWDLDTDDEVRARLDRFSGWGLDGVEAFYVTHTEAQTRLLVAEAERRGLLTTGSSDFHAPDHERFARFRAFGLFGLEPQLGPIGR